MCPQINKFEQVRWGGGGGVRRAGGKKYERSVTDRKTKRTRP